MSYSIRKMTLADTCEVQKVAQKSWKVTYDGIIPSSIQKNFLTVAYSNEMMERRLQNSLLLVAEVNERIIGFANYTFLNDENETELTAIYLHPAYQGQGIGSALLQKGIKTLGPVKKIYLDVEKENEIGKSFYTAKGFQVIAEFDDDFDGHILKTVRMMLEIK